MLPVELSRHSDQVRSTKLRRRLVFAVAVTLGLVAAALTPVSALARPAHERHNGGGLGPGCAPDRPAVAHLAGGVIVRAPRGTHLVPCLTPTGYPTGEVGIAVTNAGNVLFHSAISRTSTGLPLGILRSVNQGGSWQFVQPPSGAGIPPWTLAIDGNLGVDRRTGRVFQETPGYFPPQLDETGRVNFSDNDGRAWSVGGNPTMRFASGNDDNVKIFAGPPTRSAKHLLHGYPDAVFACAGHKPLRCQTSFDGGLRWGAVSDLPFPSELASIQGPSKDCSNFGLNGVVGKDGTVYMGYTPCNRPYVAISHDEGATWHAVRVANVETIGWGQLAVGINKHGDLYAAWVAAANRLPYLSVSRDNGRHWSRPLMIGAPGVNEAALPRLVTGARGQVAVAYFGSTNSPGVPFPPPCTTAVATGCPDWQNVTWNTYVTETFNGLDRRPLFWSASLNDPSQPTWYGCSASSLGVIRLDESNPFKSGPGFTGGCAPGTAGSDPDSGNTGAASSSDTANAGQGRQDYIGMDMAPNNNTPWVGFGQACPLGLPVLGNPRCPSTLDGGPFDSNWGVAGRLVRVRGRGRA
jgi:hypothetical protein